LYQSKNPTQKARASSMLPNRSLVRGLLELQDCLPLRPYVFESAKKTPRPIIGEVVSRVSDGEIQGGLEGVHDARYILLAFFALDSRQSAVRERSLG
jgi:hypothetical protein